VKPQISGVNEYFDSDPKDSRSDTYTPTLLVSAEVRYLKSKPSVDFTRFITAIVEDPRETGQMWEDFVQEDFDSGGLLKRPQSGMKFGSLPEFLNKPAWMSSQVREFEHWIYETDMVSLRSSPSLGVTVGPEASEEDFLALCREAAERKADLEAAKLSGKYAAKKTSLEKKISSLELKVDKYRKEMASRGFDTALNVGGKFLDALAGRRVRLSTSVTKGRMTADARGRLKEAEEMLKNYQEELENLDVEMEDEKLALVDRWMAEAENVTEVKMTPTKQNIRITHFGILWR
jgi:phage host-nuclease inhibitor protein Gam